MVHYIFVKMILLKIVAALLMTQISEADSNFAARGQFPYHVAIFDKEGSFCSGALIKDNYVVTSASCLMDETGLFPADKYYVVLDFVNSSGPTSPVVVTTTQRITHDKFQGLGIQTLEKHDIALLRLERKVELNQYVNIVDLPDLNDTFNKTSEGVLTRYQQYMRSYSDFYVTLTFSSSNVTTSSICERNIKKYFIKPKVLSQFCINHILHGKNLKFQSSGIFVQSEGNKTVLTGLAVGNIMSNNIFTNVSLYVNWIKRNTKNSLVSMHRKIYYNFGKSFPIDENFAKRGQFPYHVAILKLKTFKKDFSCSGALIKENYVITSAGCVSDFSFIYHATFGLVDSYDVTSTITIAIINSIFREENEGYELYDDYSIAISKLERRVQLNDYVSLVDLPESSETVDESWKNILTRYERYYDKKNKIYSEFALEFTNVSIGKNESCNSAGITVLHFCTFNARESNFSSVFDIAGILVKNNGNKSILIGLGTSDSNLFTNISRHVDWIKQTMNNGPDIENAILPITSKVLEQNKITSFLEELSIPIFSWSERGQFKYHVAIFDSEGSLCNGALIKDNYVLTSAACVSDDQLTYYALLGYTDSTDVTSLITVNINKIIIHEKFKRNAFYNKHNIAIVQLEEKVKLNKYIGTVDLPEPNEVINEDMKFVTRYEICRTKRNYYWSMRLDFNSAEVINNRTCKQYLKKYPLNAELCVITAKLNKNSKKVSMFIPGSILVQNNGNRTVLIGLSFRQRYMFTNVIAYADWIKGKISMTAPQ